MSLPEFLEATGRLVELLEAHGIEYLVGGSVASSAMGMPRATQDVDLLVGLPADRIDALAEALSQDFYADADQMRSALETRSAFNVIHLPTMTKCDCFVLGDEPFERSEMARRIALPLLGDAAPPLWVASPEDMVLQKLRWYRWSGERSDRQWGDVLGILRVQAGSLDLAYLRLWAERLGIADLLTRAMDG